MTENKVPRDTWVEIRQEILPPGERAPQVPEDTAQVPLIMVVKGFLEHDSAMGERAQIRTLSGRKEEGELIQVLPRHTHDFGDAVPELLEIGPRVRAMLEGGEPCEG